MCTCLFPVSHRSPVELCLPSGIIQSHLSSSWLFSLVFYLQKYNVKPQPRLISSCWLMDPGVSAAWTSKPSGLLSVAWWASLTLAPTRFKSASLLSCYLLHVFRCTKVYSCIWTPDLTFMLGPYWVITSHHLTCIIMVCASLPGLAQYSGDPKTEWHLNAHATRESLQEAVTNLPYKGGNTMTGTDPLHMCFIVYRLEDALVLGHLNSWKQHLMAICVSFV